MKWYFKVLFGSGALLLLLIALNFGVNLWIKYQLPRIVNRGNSDYAMSFKNMQVSIWNNSIVASEVIIVPKKSLSTKAAKAGVYAKIKTVRIEQFRVWDLLFEDRIKAKSLHVDQPTVMYQLTGEPMNRFKGVGSEVVAPLGQIISVPEIFLHQGELKIIEAKHKRLVFSLENFHLQLNGLLISDDILEHKIPFQFRDYRFRAERVYYRPGFFYHFKARQLSGSKGSLQLSKFEMNPELSRREFVRRIPKERDLYALRCDTLNIRKMDWGFSGPDFFFHSPKISLTRAAANIYRSKAPDDDLKKKPLYNHLLRNLKFDLKVDTLEVRHSMVEYEEEKTSRGGPGKLTFDRFDLWAHNISSGFKKQKLDEVKIKINCRFMKSSALEVDWNFNVMDRSDGFRIKGVMRDFDLSHMTAFSKPYLNVTTKGTMQEVRFDFTGNDQRDWGKLAVKYDDLKFTIYQKDDRKKKNKLLTFVARIFVKKDTKEKLKEAKVEVERIPEKSFYNFLWRSVAEGLKKILV